VCGVAVRARAASETAKAERKTQSAERSFVMTENPRDECNR